MSNEFNVPIIDNDEIIINIDEINITLTNTRNQNKNINNNTTIIHLGECEELLRKKYNINNDELIYMKKIDVIQEGMKIPKVEFDVYSKLNGTNLIKLNISVCENTKIDILIPINISGNIDQYNKSSRDYNDQCYVATSDNNRDIILKSRIKDFIENNKTVCQEDCDFTDYNYKYKIANCSCNPKKSSLSIKDMCIDMENIVKTMKNPKNIANINILVCYHELFSKKGISKNIGAILIIIIIIFHLICIILFYVIFRRKIKKNIKRITIGIKFWKFVKSLIKGKKIEDALKNKNEKIKIKKRKKRRHIPKDKNQKHKIDIISPINLSPKSDNQSSHKSDSNPPIKKNNLINININNINQNINKNMISIKKQETQMNDKNSESILQLNDRIKKKIEKVKSTMEYNYDELNKFSYKYALKYDKRTYCQYYISLLKTKHILLFSFSNIKDYNSKIIKIDLFFVSFVFYLFDNALFFDDIAIDKINIEDNGQYNFSYQLPKIIYSSLISLIINSLLKFLALSQKGLSSFKKNKLVINISQRKANLRNQLKIKFISYFITSTILLLFFWFYISMFCAIYKNTQIHLISDTLISFGLSLIYPFGYYLLPGLFRIPSLSKPKNKTKEYLYNISLLIQII